MEKFGVDNWAEIADFLGTKTAHECEVHYYTFYYKSATDKWPSLSDVIIERGTDGEVTISKKKQQMAIGRVAGYMRAREAMDREEDVHCKVDDKKQGTSKKGRKGRYRERITDVEAHEPKTTEVVGFMPLRGDFNIEYDNDAELLLADMEFFDEDKKSEEDLKYEILKLYNARLDERIRRKKFVIEKGLLDTKRQQQMERKRPKEEREIIAQMKPFMRFCEGDEFKQLVEGLIEERALHQRLEELKLFRYPFCGSHSE